MSMQKYWIQLDARWVAVDAIDSFGPNGTGSHVMLRGGQGFNVSVNPDDIKRLLDRLA